MNSKNGKKRPKNSETELFHKCLYMAEGFIRAQLSLNFSVAYVLRQATERFAHVWIDYGLDISNSNVRTRFINDYAQKTLWYWKRQPKKMQPYIENREKQVEEAGLWIHNDIARLSRLQSILEGNERKEKGRGGDKLALDALKIAGETGQRQTDLVPPPGVDDIKQLLANTVQKRKRAKSKTRKSNS